MGVGLTDLMQDVGLLVTVLTSASDCNALFGLPDNGAELSLVSDRSIGPLDIKMRITDDVHRDILSRSIAFSENTPDKDKEMLWDYYLDNFTREKQDLLIWTIDFLATGLIVHYHQSHDETAVSMVTFSSQQVAGEELVAEFICTHQDSETTLRLRYRATYTNGAHGYMLEVFVNDEEEPRAKLAQKFRRV